MPTVRITSWQLGLHTIELLRIIRSLTGWGLAETKEKVERMLEGTPLEIECNDAMTAYQFETEVTSIGCICDEREN